MEALGNVEYIRAGRTDGLHGAHLQISPLARQHFCGLQAVRLMPEETESLPHSTANVEQKGTWKKAYS